MASCFTLAERANDSGLLAALVHPADLGRPPYASIFASDACAYAQGHGFSLARVDQCLCGADLRYPTTVMSNGGGVGASVQPPGRSSSRVGALAL